jgi:hypothetical protein
MLDGHDARRSFHWPAVEVLGVDFNGHKKRSPGLSAGVSFWLLVCTEHFIRVDEGTESPKVAQSRECALSLIGRAAMLCRHYRWIAGVFRWHACFWHIADKMLQRRECPLSAKRRHVTERRWVDRVRAGLFGRFRLDLQTPSTGLSAWGKRY